MQYQCASQTPSPVVRVPRTPRRLLPSMVESSPGSESLTDSCPPTSSERSPEKESASPSSSDAPTRRRYTQAELEAAVAEIRNGQLGTRRASVLYDIPRSTLRNKVYKLEADDLLRGIAPKYRRRRGGGGARPKQNDAVAALETLKAQAKVLEEATTLLPTDLPQKEEVVEEEAVVEEEEEEEVLPLSTEDPVVEVLRVEAEEEGEEKMEEDGSSNQNGDEFAWVTTLTTTDWSKAWNAPPVEEEEGEEAGPSTSSKTRRTTPRGKRGLYKTYGLDALEAAVEKVRRGEMKSHRAATSFGVPHSTLEYKVKERIQQESRAEEDHSPELE